MPIDVALLGCGHPHVPDLLAVVGGDPALRMAAAWDADRSAIPLALDGLATTRPETAVGRADLVVVCAPTDQRPALVLEAARAGRPVLVESPIALGATRAQRLAREVEGTRTPAAAALHLRELPALDRLAGVLRERLLGRLQSVTAAYAHPGALDGRLEGPRAWLRDPGRAGGGGFATLAPQLLDALTCLPGGPPRLGAVAYDRARPGAVGPGAARVRSGAGPEVGGSALGTFGDVPLTLRAGWATRPGGLVLEVAGATGTATLRDGTLAIARDDGEPERWIGAPPDAGDALRAFAARVAARRPPRDGLTPAVRAQAALEAAVAIA